MVLRSFHDFVVLRAIAFYSKTNARLENLIRLSPFRASNGFAAERDLDVIFMIINIEGFATNIYIRVCLPAGRCV